MFVTQDMACFCIQCSLLFQNTLGKGFKNCHYYNMRGGDQKISKKRK